MSRNTGRGILELQDGESVVRRKAQAHAPARIGVRKRVLEQVVEEQEDAPDAFFGNPRHQRTRTFLSQVLH
jgi:ABC-type polar amino acid transport system ATPase subunit